MHKMGEILGTGPRADHKGRWGAGIERIFLQLFNCFAKKIEVIEIK